MYDLLVSGHYPVINQSGVARNEVIKIYFNDIINPASVKNTSLTVTDSLYNPVAGSVNYDYTDKFTSSGLLNVLTFTPNTYMDPSTTYYVYVNKYPDCVQSVNSGYIKDTYKYTFYTGIGTTGDEAPSYQEQLKLDLAAAVARQNWAEAARLQAIIDGGTSSSSGVALGSTPSALLLSSHYPTNMQSDIPMKKLRFIKLEFNDAMPSSGIEYSRYISVVEKNVLE